MPRYLKNQFYREPEAGLPLPAPRFSVGKFLFKALAFLAVGTVMAVVAACFVLLGAGDA